MKYDEVLDHVLGKIQSAVLCEMPFLYLHVYDFWPKEFYQELLDTMPEKHFVRRGAFGAGKTTMCSLLEERGESWRIVTNVLEDEEFRDALCMKLETPNDGYNRFLLHRDWSGYNIPPHLDVLSKRITFLSYFASDHDHWEEGTLLLRPKLEARLFDLRNRHQYWLDFQRVGIIPYVPNVFAAFVPSDQSWHAVDIRFRSDDPIQARYAIRGFMFAPDAHLPYIFEEDTKERRIKWLL